VQARVVVPSRVLSGTVDATVITAASRTDQEVSAAITDTTTIGHVAGVSWITVGYNRYADPGEVLTFTHSLSNAGNYTDTFALIHHSSQDWPVGHGASVSVGYQQTTTVWISLTVPTTALSSTVETTVITATSQADMDIQVAVSGATTVRQVAGVDLAPDRSGSAVPGSVVTYTHTLTNSGNGADSFVIDCQSSQGWNVDCKSQLALGPGQTATILVSLPVPADVTVGTTDMTLVSVQSLADVNVQTTVTDVTIVQDMTNVWYIYLPLVLRLGSTQ
jgi:uncharacterized membrane protein